MKPPRLRTYPHWRLAAAFAAGSLWFFAIPWGGEAMAWLGAGYNLFLLALTVADYIWLRDAGRCEIRRTPFAVLSIGERNPVWIEAAHRGVRAINVIARDEPPPEFDAEPRVVTFSLSPEDEQRRNYKVCPHERGDYRFGDLNIRFTTAIGLLMRQTRLPSEMQVKVYPDVFQTRKHLILARENRVAQMGLHKSKMRGQDQEFERLRDYVPDDSPRHIDWKATARRGNLIVREYDVEQSQNMMILLDVGRTMASHAVEADGSRGMTKADYAINAAVMLAHVASQADDRVGLFCFARGPVAYLAPGKGKTQAAALLEALYPLHPRAEESMYFDNLLLLSRKQRKRSLVFLFTDLIDPEASRSLISSVGLLVGKHLVVCVALSDYELSDIIDAEPRKPADTYTQAVALGIIRERKKALAQLASMGVVTIDATPRDLTVSAVNKYLQLKREARL